MDIAPLKTTKVNKRMLFLLKTAMEHGALLSVSGFLG